MSTIKWCLDALRAQIPTSLEKSKGNLDSAASIIASIEVPSDFGYGAYLGSLPSILKGIKMNVNSSKEWVIAVTRRFEEAENKSMNPAFGALFNANNNGYLTNYWQNGSGLLYNPLLDTFKGTVDTLIKTTIPEEGITIENPREVPEYIQQEFNAAFGSGTVSGGGCGVCSLATIGTTLLGETILPDELAAEYGRFYIEGVGADWTMMKAFAEDYGLTVEQCNWEEWSNGAIDKALEEGKMISVCVGGDKESIFTDGGHYITIYGKTEDGKYLVRDSNMANHIEYNEYADPVLTEGFTNGFEFDQIFDGAMSSWIFSANEATKVNNDTNKSTTITREDLYNDIMKEAVRELNDNINPVEIASTNTGNATGTNSATQKDTVKMGTPEAFLAACQSLRVNQLDWVYAGLGTDYVHTLKHTNFEDVINNKDKGTCCATYIASALYLAGYCTEEDLTVDGIFNPNYQVNIANMCEKKGWETVTNYEDLQPGDIIFIRDSETGDIIHVEGYAGNDSFYSASQYQEIRTPGAYYRDEPYWHLSKDWFAYRLPDISDENTKEITFNNSGNVNVGNVNNEVTINDKGIREEQFKKDGYIYFDKEDGRHMKETWCDLEIENSIALEETKKVVGDLGYWVRDDGVCMFGPYVIVAADIPHLDGRTPRCRI